MCLMIWWLKQILYVVFLLYWNSEWEHQKLDKKKTNQKRQKKNPNQNDDDEQDPSWSFSIM